MSPEQPVIQLTVRELETLIATVVQRVVREELRRDYYVNENGTKVMYATEEIAPAYLAELQQDYQAIQKGEMKLTSGDQVIQELRDLGLDL